MRSIFNILIALSLSMKGLQAGEVFRLTYDSDPKSKESALSALSYLKSKQKIPDFLISLKMVGKPCSFNPTVQALHLCFEKGEMKTIYYNKELINGTIALFKED